MSWPLSNTIPAVARFRKLSRIAGEPGSTTRTKLGRPLGWNAMQRTDPSGQSQQSRQMIIDRCLRHSARTHRRHELITPRPSLARASPDQVHRSQPARQSSWLPSPTSTGRPNPIRT